MNVYAHKFTRQEVLMSLRNAMFNKSIDSELALMMAKIKLDDVAMSTDSREALKKRIAQTEQEHDGFVKIVAAIENLMDEESKPVESEVAV